MTGTGRPNGRPPKPTEVKRALGNPGHRALPAPQKPGQGLSPVTSIPARPTLGLDGSALWDRLWSAGEKWLSPNGDYAVMELLCRATDEAEYLRRALALGEVPRHYVLPNGSFVSHPYVTQLKELRSQMTAWLSALGFSPTDRARLGLAEVRTLDALDELQRRREERLRVVVIPEAKPAPKKKVEDDGRE